MGSRILRGSRGAPSIGLAIAALVAGLVPLVILGRSAGGAAAAPVDPADLSLTKSDSPNPVTPGGQLTYTIQVTNGGPDAATNTVVTDDLPKQLDFVSATASVGSCDNKGGKVTCSLGTLAAPGSPGSTATVTINTTVKKNVNAATISNTASVTSGVPDPQANNNSDTETTTVSQAPPGPTCLGKKATIIGTPGNDILSGTDKNDVILALAGGDQVFALGGKDLVCARGGPDRVDGGPAPDTVAGGRGRDLLIGRGGGDELRGRGGRDRLRGNSGNDLLAGGHGRDRCRGGPGSDTLRSCER